MKYAQSRDPFGKKKLGIIDRFGVFLSLLALKKHLPKINDLEVLDLGCGYEAKFLLALREKIKKGVGVDFSINPNLNKIPNFTFVESSIEEAVSQLKNISPHVVLLVSVLEHLYDPIAVLKGCYQLLRQEGVLLINVPTWGGKFFLEFSAFKLGTSPQIEMDDHKMYYDKRDLWPMLIKAGFKPSKVKLTYHKFGLNLFAVACK